MAEIKISELEPTTDLEGLYTIGSDKNNLSKKVSLQFLKDAANYANEQGDYAKQAGDTVNGNAGVTDYPVFSASATYSAGDVVRYNGVLYEFTGYHSGSWNGNDVVATSINSQAQKKLTELESELTELRGQSWSEEGNTASADTTIIIKEGETYVLDIILSKSVSILLNGHLWVSTSGRYNLTAQSSGALRIYRPTTDACSISISALGFIGASVEELGNRVDGEIAELTSNSMNGDFIGKGSVLSAKEYNYFIKGHTYRLTFPNPNWSKENINPGFSGYAVFVVVMMKNGAETSSLVRLVETSEIKGFYDFTIPSAADYDSIRIGGRADVSERVQFSVTDKTATATNQSIAFLPNATKIPNVDTEKGILSLYNGIILIGGESYELGTDEKYNTIPLKSSASSAQKIVFNKTTLEVYPLPWNTILSDSEYILGAVRVNYGESYWSYQNGNFIFDFTIDGLKSSYSEVGLAYEGEPFKIRRNKYARKQAYHLNVGRWHQSMAIHGDKVVQLIYNHDINGIAESGKLSAHIFSLSNETLLGSVDVPYGSNSIPHCNTACFGSEYASAESAFPLLYVSQWDGERKCLVYDITESAGSYSFRLVQTISTSGISSDIEGIGMRDWVVDVDNREIYSVAYFLNSDRVSEGNKTMVLRFRLPSLGEGDKVLSSADLIDSFELPFMMFFQDKHINGGKMYIASGMADFQEQTNIRVVDLALKKIVTIIPLGATFNAEPEGLSVYEDKLLMDYGLELLYEIITE